LNFYPQENAGIIKRHKALVNIGGVVQNEPAMFYPGVSF